MKTKTLILTSEFPPLPGGIGHHAFHLAKYLQLAGYEVTVITDHREVDLDTTFDKEQSFKTVRVKRNPFVYSSRVLKAIKYTKSNTTIIASGKFSLWMAGLLSLMYPKKKYIAVLHGSELKAGGLSGQKLTRWCLKRFHKLIAVSQFTKNRALTINPSLTIEVINNGIELYNAKREYSQKTESISLITVGNLTARKGQQNVIKVLPVLKEQFPNIHYHCVGIPTEKEVIVNLANALQIAKHVTFYGALPDEEKNRILQESTVFLMLSDEINNDFEGFGIAVLEANALGLPAIGSINSGIEDAICEGYSGRLVHPHQPNEVLNALKDILANYEAYSQNSKEWAGRFEWNVMVNKYINIIEVGT